MLLSSVITTMRTKPSRKVKFRKNGKSLKMRTSLHRKIPMLVGLRKTTRFILDTKITLNAMPTVN